MRGSLSFTDPVLDRAIRAAAAIRDDTQPIRLADVRKSPRSSSRRARSNRSAESSVLDHLAGVYVTHETKVTDLSPLASLVNLSGLVLWACGGAVDVRPLARLTKLEVLELESRCGVANLSRSSGSPPSALSTSKATASPTSPNSCSFRSSRASTSPTTPSTAPRSAATWPPSTRAASWSISPAREAPSPKRRHLCAARQLRTTQRRPRWPTNSPAVLLPVSFARTIIRVRPHHLYADGSARSRRRMPVGVHVGLSSTGQRTELSGRSGLNSFDRPRRRTSHSRECRDYKEVVLRSVPRHAGRGRATPSDHRNSSHRTSRSPRPDSRS